VERKAAFIAQVMHGGNVAREIDDIGDQALSYAEVKALAAGNPYIVEKAGVDAEIAKLTRLRAAHQRDQSTLARTHATATARAQLAQLDPSRLMQRLEHRLARLEHDLDDATAGDLERSVEAVGRVQHWLQTIDDPWLHVRREAVLGELARIQHRFEDAVVHL